MTDLMGSSSPTMNLWRRAAQNLSHAQVNERTVPLRAPSLLSHETDALGRLAYRHPDDCSEQIYPRRLIELP
jgi:hypothetical protein